VNKGKSAGLPLSLWLMLPAAALYRAEAEQAALPPICEGVHTAHGQAMAVPHVVQTARRALSCRCD